MASHTTWGIRVAPWLVAVLAACGASDGQPATTELPGGVDATEVTPADGYGETLGDVAMDDARDVEPAEVDVVVPDTAEPDSPLTDGIVPDVPGQDPAGPDSPGPDNPAKDGGDEGGGGPKTCTTDADCTGAGVCPQEAAQGCICVTGKDTQKVCRPACTVDADCPKPPDKTLVCSIEGICVPEGAAPDGNPDAPTPDVPDVPPADVHPQDAPPPDIPADAPPPDAPPPDVPPAPDAAPEGPVGPTACATDNDCLAAGACPPDAALGCACKADPQSQMLCIPICTTDLDCPKPPDKTLVCSADGICVPQ